MASGKQLMAMIRSHAAGDGDRFLSIAETIAADAERAGHRRIANEIRSLVEAVRDEQDERRPASRPIPIAAPRGELAGLLRVAYPETRLSDVVLGGGLEDRLIQIVREHRERATLARHGISPRRKLLLSGPPGTGKSMTASALAGELGLPLFTVMLDGVITKYLGETAAKLRLVFDAMKHARGVYFFDEVDALATRRGAENDIGEARRMLNSFLQFLDEDDSTSIVIAATNHRELLDRAIFRRFDAAIAYGMPSPGHVRRIVAGRLPQFALDGIRWDEVEAKAANLSQADIVAAADDAARTAVLDADGALATDHLIWSFLDRSAADAN